MSILDVKNSVEQSVKDENWYAALALALILPDIRGKLENPTSINSKTRYIAWFDKYLLKYYTSDFHGKDNPFLTGSDCYALRCAFLHEGSEDITTQKAKEILSEFVFATTGSHRIMFNSTTLLLDVSEFCKEMCEGVEAWYSNVKNNKDINERINNMLKIRMDGYSHSSGTYVR